MAAAAAQPEQLGGASNLAAQAVHDLEVGGRLVFEQPPCVVVRDGHVFYSIETPFSTFCNLTYNMIMDKLNKGLSYYSKAHDDELFAALWGMSG